LGRRDKSSFIAPAVYVILTVKFYILKFYLFYILCNPFDFSHDKINVFFKRKMSGVE